MAFDQLTVPYKEGYDYGIGADSRSGSPKGLAVKGAVSPVGGGGAPIVSFDVTRITTTESLEQALGISAEASYGCASFGAGISARFDFARNCQVQTSSAFFLVNASIKLGFEQIDDPELSERAAELIRDPATFAGAYGNVFVRGVGRGGLFIGVLRIDTQSQSDAENISAQIKGSYGLFSADAETNFNEIKKKFISNVHCSMYHEGGPASLKITDPSNPLELLNNANLFLNSFQENPDTNAVPYYVTLSAMEIARGPLPLNAAEIQKSQDVLAFCAKARSQILDKINLLMFVQTNIANYTMPPPETKPSLADAMRMFQKDYDTVQSCAAAALHDPASAKMPADFDASYPAGVLPDPMPVPKEGKPTTVPDLSGCANWQDVSDKITAAHLVPHQLSGDGGYGSAFVIQKITPPPGTPIPEGQTVTVVTKPMIVRFEPWDPRRDRVFEPVRKPIHI